MCKPSALFILVLTILSVAKAAADPSVPKLANIGRSASSAEIQALNLSVMPNGEGLPEGTGTPREGKEIYRAQCASCHGDHGEGRPEFPALVGGRDSLASATPVLTVGSYWPYATTIFDYVRRAMPYATPGSLTNNEVYAVTAWLLHANGIVTEETVLNRDTLTKVRMPNRDGFVRDPRPDVKANR